MSHQERDGSRQGISIFGSNLGYYNEGFITGRWLDLPVTDAELDAYIENDVRRDAFHDELFISDYETPSWLPYKIDTHDDMHEINYLAKILACSDRRDHAALEAYGRADWGEADLVEVANLALVESDLPFHRFSSYDLPYPSHPVEPRSPEEWLGLVLGLKGGFYDTLDELGYADYFDWEGFGRDQSVNEGLLLTDEGFLDSEEVAISKLITTRQELRETAKYLFGEPYDPKRVVCTKDELRELGFDTSRVNESLARPEGREASVGRHTRR